MTERWLCQKCEGAGGSCLCEGPTFRFRKIDHEASVLKAARELCEALVSHGFGSTSELALPGEYDALVMALDRSEAALRHVR